MPLAKMNMQVIVILFTHEFHSSCIVCKTDALHLYLLLFIAVNLNSNVRGCQAVYRIHTHFGSSPAHSMCTHSYSKQVAALSNSQCAGTHLQNEREHFGTRSLLGRSHYVRSLKGFLMLALSCSQFGSLLVNFRSESKQT